MNSTTKTLCAAYDLGVFPTSFDLSVFLIAAQGDALEHGYEHVRLLLVDGEHHGVRFEGNDYESLYPPEMRLWKVSHILQAMPRLCPLVERTVSIIPRSELSMYETMYPRLIVASNYNKIYFLAWRQLHRYRENIGFRSSLAAQHYLQKWLTHEMPSGGRPIVCLTLRESRWSTGRNTSVDVLAAAASRLRAKGYWPVVVPDTERAFDRRGSEWKGISFCAPAALNLELRMALYEQAHLNLFTNSGPALLAIGSYNCRYIYLDIAHEDTSEATCDKIRELGMIPGLTPFRPGPYQRWIWEPLSVELVLNAVTAMTDAIDKGIAPEDTGYPYFAVPFDEDNYLEENPEVISAIRHGSICSALEHYARIGISQGFSPISARTELARQLSSRASEFPTPKKDKDLSPRIADQPEFDEDYYLNLYPDVANAVTRGQFHSGYQHYLAFGRHEGRFMPPIAPENFDRPADNSEMLLAYYDITTHPESFDFCLFLMAAEVWRKRLGAGGIQVLIMAAAVEGWKYRNLSPEVWRQYLDTNTWWRIQHIVVPVANMLRTVREVRVSTDRSECENIWGSARYRYPVQKVLHDVPIYQAYRDALIELYRGGIAHLLEAPSSAHEYVDQMLRKWGTNNQRLIVITIREAIFAVERNSNVPAWLTMAEELQMAGFGVVIIPDTDAILTGKSLLENCSLPLGTLASFNQYIRMAFYQRAHLNLFPNGGCAMLGILGAKTRYLMFFKVQQTTAGTDTEFLSHLGFRFGQQTPSPFQRALDQPDTLENLQREVWSLLDEMRNSTPASHTAQESGENTALSLCAEGIRHYEHETFDQAEACFKKALALTPGAPRALVGLSRLCYERQQLNEAKKYLQLAQRHAPGNMDILKESAQMALGKAMHLLRQQMDHVAAPGNEISGHSIT